MQQPCGVCVWLRMARGLLGGGRGAACARRLQTHPSLVKTSRSLPAYFSAADRALDSSALVGSVCV